MTPHNVQYIVQYHEAMKERWMYCTEDDVFRSSAVNDISLILL